MFGFNKKDAMVKKVDDVLKEVVGNIEVSVKKQLTSFLDDSTKIPALQEKIQKLKNELADLTKTKELEIRDIEHLVKCKTEKAEIEQSKKENELEKALIKKEMDLQKEYFVKTCEQLDVAKKDMQTIYAQILERLPNLNASLEIKRRK